MKEHETSSAGEAENRRKDEPKDKPGERPLWWRILRSVFIVYVGIVIVLFILQRKIIYPADSSRPPVPRNRIEEFSVKTEDNETIQGWYWPGDEDLVLLLFHGNAGHRGHRAFWLEMLRSISGAGICIFDYRGYGGSTGSPTEAGLYRDAEAVLSWLRAKGAEKFVYIGNSLGGAVALELATRHPPQALVLQSAFTTMADAAAAAYPFLPARWLVIDRYENIAKLPKIRCPVLLVHGKHDRLVPPEHSRKLFTAANEPKDLVIIDADHNDLIGRKYRETLDEFLGRITP